MLARDNNEQEQHCLKRKLSREEAAVPGKSQLTSSMTKKEKKTKVDLFKYFQQQVQSKNPPRLVSFKRKVSSSKYKGVLYVKSQSKWRAQVCLGGKKKYIGSYDSELEAATARDSKIKQLFGDRPELLNFPDNCNPVYAHTAALIPSAYSPLSGSQQYQQDCTNLRFKQMPLSAFTPIQTPGHQNYLTAQMDVIDELNPYWWEKWQAANVFQDLPMLQQTQPILDVAHRNIPEEE